MRIRSHNILCVLVIVATVLQVAFVRAQALPAGQTSAPPTLRDLIDVKAKELQQIQNQRDAVQKNLDEIEKSSVSLKRDIRAADANISQLNLSVKANTLTIEQLGLEIQSLGGDIENIQTSIANKKSSIARLYLELQEHDHDSLLMVLLRSKSLSDTVAEAQSIASLNSALGNSITDLERLRTDLGNALVGAQTKKVKRSVEQENLANLQSIVKDAKSEKQQLLTVTQSKEQIYQQQLDMLKQVQDSLSEEIEQYESVLRKTIDSGLLPLPRPSALAWPVPGAGETQGYGRTSFALKTYKSAWHNGIDLGAAIGTPVVAAEDGVVINVGNQDAYRGCYKAGYGKFIEIKHENGLTTLYGHLSRYIVSVGTHVTRGQVVAYVGSTGWATGAHLHFTVFATQTLSPAKGSMPEGSQSTRSCGPMPVGGDLDPHLYVRQ